jgi:hypothetical protein
VGRAPEATPDLTLTRPSQSLLPKSVLFRSADAYIRESSKNHRRPSRGCGHPRSDFATVATAFSQEGNGTPGPVCNRAFAHPMRSAGFTSAIRRVIWCTSTNPRRSRPSGFYCEDRREGLSNRKVFCRCPVFADRIGLASRITVRDPESGEFNALSPPAPGSGRAFSARNHRRQDRI